MRILSVSGYSGPALAAAAIQFWALVWMVPAEAGSVCRNGDAGKVCLDINAEPTPSVQPSGLAGTPTFVKYTATLNNLTNGTSTRFVTVSMSLSPATGFTSYAAPGSASCSVAGSTLSCVVDKLVSGTPATLTATANAPPYQGASTATSLVNTSVLGWQGNTASTSTSVAVDSHSGATHVPANTAVTLSTAPPVADRSLQTSPTEPLYGEVTLPPKPFAYEAQILVIGNGPILNCVDDLYISATYGGPYICRDVGPPFDQGNAQRWVQLSTSGVTFDAAAPANFTLIWDQSIMSALQLPPTAATPTGTPPLAVFHNINPTGQETGAIADVCAAPAIADCLSGVTRHATGDWSASFLKVTDGTDLASAETGLRPLLAVLDFVVGIADAGLIPPGTIMK